MLAISPILLSPTHIRLCDWHACQETKSRVNSKPVFFVATGFVLVSLKYTPLCDTTLSSCLSFCLSLRIFDYMCDRVDTNLWGILMAANLNQLITREQNNKAKNYTSTRTATKRALVHQEIRNFECCHTR